ncbi:hypothetical protein QR680_017027 [Steinernema hermaphroditum]|uniref:Uncharacterized protein n=1 Tax=Steinernema hermaphroditum TaxID=289476 RepID=A0AA39LNI1_9BILA|nr:hypothetical protein QR680_017027 [Steinernema hermaphroditum]
MTTQVGPSPSPYGDSDVGTIIGCVMIAFAIFLCIASQFKKYFLRHSKSMVKSARSRFASRPRQSVFSIDTRGSKLDHYSPDRIALRFLHDAFYCYLMNKGDSREHLQRIMSMLHFSEQQMQDVAKKLWPARRRPVLSTFVENLSKYKLEWLKSCGSTQMGISWNFVTSVAENLFSSFASYLAFGGIETSFPMGLKLMATKSAKGKMALQ